MKKNILTIAVLCLFTGSSCSDWLDVQPNSQIKASELFSSEAGYKEALAGIYTLLTTENLYGKELRFGMIGVTGREWSSFPTAYDDDSQYNYDATQPTTRIDNVWKGMYNAISNANKLLENIDASKNLFSGVNFDVIKGEALALRAFIHFDLLRCFGAAFTVDPSQDAIPYVTAYTSNQTTQYTVYEVLTRITDDLKKALMYLESDPIYTGQVITEFDDNGYLINRQLHLNYYAVEGLLARIYLYMEEYDEAELYASDVIASNAFTWTKQDDFVKGIDYTGASEQLFGLNITSLSDIALNYLSQEGTSIFSLSDANLLAYYESNTDDYRYLYLFKKGTGASATRYYLTKYNDSESSDTYYANKVSMIKLSEMYFILAEYQKYKNKSVIAPLNEIRKARGVALLTQEPSDFRSLMTNEFRKEFFGEGQLFFYYKRLNARNIFGTDANLIDTKAYIFPLPKAEYESANRKNNR